MATEKQKKAIQNVMDNGGNVTKAMRDAGYSEATINNPSNLTKSKSWEECLETVSDEELAEVLKEGLYADKPIGNGEVFADYPTRHKYADTWAKLKSRYPAEKREVEVTLPTPILGAITNEE